MLFRESVGDITGEETLLVSPTSGPSGRLRPSHVPVADATPKRGRALPVDVFISESTGLRFEDWLLALEQEAVWNKWSRLERLIQLEGNT